MEFFNKKEDVIDVVLTRKGKKLFSEGKFNPTDYSFHDYTVTYDTEYNKLPEEEQNAIVDRIKNEPVIRPNGGWQNPESKEYEVPYFPEMGSYDTTKNKKPAWDVQVLEGEITGSATFTAIEDLGKQNISEKIPQIDLICKYEINQVEKKLFLKKSFDNILLKILEENTISTKENFYIEAFKYDYTESSTEPKVSKLNFDLEDFNENNFYYYFDIVLDNDGIDKLVDYEELAGPEFIIDEDEC